MTTENILLLPGKVRIAIEDRGSLNSELRMHLGDAFAMYSSNEDIPQRARTLHLRLGSFSAEDGLRTVEPGVQGRPGLLVDTNYRVKIWEAGGPEPSLFVESETSALEWVMVLAQLSLLEQGFSFIHCAGLEKAGRVVLFPSWGGVGKTAITKLLVDRHGWNVLGDDLVIIDRQGRCFGFPKSMVLYPYHRPMFPEVFEAGKGPIAPGFANEMLTKAAFTIKPVLRRVPTALAIARKNNPQSVRIPPSEVFGEQALARQGQLAAVVWLERVAGLEKPNVGPGDDRFTSRIAGTTMSEFDRHCVGLLPTLFGLGVSDFGRTIGSMASLVDESVAHGEHLMVSLPSDMPLAAVPNAVIDLLDERVR